MVIMEGGGSQARDERTVALVGKLCARAHAGNPKLVSGALSRSVKLISGETEEENANPASSSFDVRGLEASIAASVQRQLVRTGKRDEETGLPLSVPVAPGPPVRS